MSMKTVTFEAPEESIATIDDIAINLGIDRAEVLREALALYLAGDDDLQADLAEAIRQADAGETISHEEVLAEFESWKTSVKDRKAA
jgi:predicted transcriptional regulator